LLPPLQPWLAGQKAETSSEVLDAFFAARPETAGACVLRRK
jgi:hypothetical protein